MSLLVVENPDAFTLPLGNALAGCEALLDAAGPVEGAHVAVIGDGALPVLCALIRRGAAAAAELQLFERGHVDPVEIAIIPAAGDLEPAARAVALAVRALLTCGRIVVQVPLVSAQGSLIAQHVRALLARSGFATMRCIKSQNGFLISADKPLFGFSPSAPYA